MPTSGNHQVDRSTALQQGTREFAGVYERNAYLVYNLALRITTDRSAAIEAACSAFLGSLSSGDADAELPAITVRRALPLAREKPDAEAAGDEDAQAMLRAGATLAAPQRAALALIGLSGADTARVAGVLETSEEAAASVTERAWEAFASALHTPVNAAQAAYRAWLWAEPPIELWERLYPSFYAELERRVSAGADDADAVTISAIATVASAARRPSRKERRRARRAERDARRGTKPGRLRRTLRAVPVGWVALLAAVAVGAAGAYAGGLIGPRRSPSTALGAGHAVRKLSPAQLAKLRAEERQAALAYAAQQQLAQRQAQAQRALELAAARNQQAKSLAAARAAAKRQQQAAIKRAKQLAAQQRALQAQLVAQTPQPSTTSSSSPPPSQSNSTNKPSSSSSQSGSGSKHGSGNGSGTSTSPTPSQAQQSCLYNANNGTWVCPQK